MTTKKSRVLTTSCRYVVIASSRVQITTLVLGLKACERLLFPLLHSEIEDNCTQASDEEENQKKIPLLTHLRRFSYYTNLHFCSYLADSVFQQSLMSLLGVYHPPTNKNSWRSSKAESIIPDVSFNVSQQGHFFNLRPFESKEGSPPFSLTFQT